MVTRLEKLKVMRLKALKVMQLEKLKVMRLKELKLMGLGERSGCEPAGQRAEEEKARAEERLTAEWCAVTR